MVCNAALLLQEAPGIHSALVKEFKHLDLDLDPFSLQKTHRVVDSAKSLLKPAKGYDNRCLFKCVDVLEHIEVLKDLQLAS